ncbi:oxidoreductase [Parahaliea mediterranea]|uniref:oxidoreductase n=1 Tax=Parahaliea mediterranea TaxID=651086 RepID=UPI000E2F0764|nr:oxidoreductase [Parahaliea mediterranea]
MEAKDSVWLITGCSTGFGREIAQAALQAGARVAVTARRLEAIADIGQCWPETALCLALDVTDAGQREAAVAQAIAHFGQLDVLVNNAGYGYVAAVEEGEDAAVRAMFEANFFGALHMALAVLPHFRAQGSGRILNNSSQAGLMANPGTGYYSASKYALEGLMEALGKEVEPFNIQVVSVQPGAFRTDWSGRSMQRSARRMPEYAEHVGSRLDMIAAIDGKQPGDPVRAAQLFVQLGTMDDPPPTLVLGAGLLASYRDKLTQAAARLDAWEQASVSVDYPPQEGAG